MKFKELSAFLARLESTQSRNEITAILSELFNKSDPLEIDKIVYLVLGQLAPNYEGLVLNIAEKMMLRVISQAYEKGPDEVRALYKEKGDIGEVAEIFAQKTTSGLTSLTVSNVFERLLSIANLSGEGSQERKVTETARLLKDLDSLSARYVSRIPVGKLRLGFSDMTILDALSMMLTGSKSARKPIEDAFNVYVDTGRIAKLLKEKGLKGIEKIEPKPGIPIRPALAERLPSAEKILEKVGSPLIVEPKFDGFRTELHIWSEDGEKKVRIFSRNLENTTAMFPDLVEAAKKLPLESAIFDGEAIAYDAKTDRFLPFQETAQRKRKHGVDEAVSKLPLKLFVFDILYKDGKNLLKLPFEERRRILENVNFKNSPTIILTHQDRVDDPDKIRDLIQKYLSEGLEGALIKKIDAIYKAGGRGYHWVKYKKNTVKGIADTIDCLVLGTYSGRGKRAGFGVGAFLVGVKDGGRFLSTSKIGTGLSDDQWRELDTRTKKIKTGIKPKEYEVDKNLSPDVWVVPNLVVEILADEITKSPIHLAGLALRFPRLIRFRDDKTASDTTTLKELRNLFEMQKAS